MNKILLMILAAIMLLTLNVCAQEVQTNYPFVKEKNLARALDYIAGKDIRVVPSLERLYEQKPSLKVSFILVEVKYDVTTYTERNRL